MSEEVKQEKPAVQPPKPKQYLLLIDDIGMAFLSKVMPGITYVEVSGMNMQGTEGFQFLVTPTPKPIVVTTPVEGVKPEEAPAA